ncbi:MAG: hypothetical protein REH83_00370 [Rickettsiella sp.]|nr:hypothetical protein [Rickettsiella sp.]
MDIKISASSESLINHLLALESLNSCKKEKVFINYCIEQIEKIAIIRFNLKYLSGLEKEIEQLNNTEDEFTSNLYRLITYFQIIDNYQHLNSLFRFFTVLSCFLALTTIGLVMSVMIIGATLTPLAGILLTFAVASSFIIFQTSASILGKSSFLSYMEDKIAVLTQTLKRITISLDQDISSLESKINYKEINNPKFAPSSAPAFYFQNATSNHLKPTYLTSTINFFKKNELKEQNISAKNYYKMANQSFSR